MDDEVICALTPFYAGTEYPLCPHLTSLDIRVPSTCDETLLLTMIESRAIIDPDDARVSRLKSVHIDFHSRELPTESLMNSFNRLENNGLRVTYKQEERWELW
jgi:hypothetical protein